MVFFYFYKNHFAICILGSNLKDFFNKNHYVIIVAKIESAECQPIYTIRDDRR